jgi:hypothetical protein
MLHKGKLASELGLTSQTAKGLCDGQSAWLAWPLIFFRWEEQSAHTPARVSVYLIVQNTDSARSCRCQPCLCPRCTAADAEAEESGIRPRTMSDSDTEDAAPEPTTPPRSRAGPAVVAATATEAAAPAAQQQEEQEEGGDVATATAADAQRLEAALVSSGGASEEQEQQEEAVAHAEEEMEANLESMSQEVRGRGFLFLLGYGSTYGSSASHTSQLPHADPVKGLQLQVPLSSTSSAGSVGPLPLPSPPSGRRVHTILAHPAPPPPRARAHATSYGLLYVIVLCGCGCTLREHQQGQALKSVELNATPPLVYCC